GKKTVAEGKDLTAIKYIIGTGGALTRLPGKMEILEKIKHHGKEQELYPTEAARVLIDEDYIFSSLGVLSKSYHEDALRLMKKSLRIGE
ncbi:MAG TPA: DNA mismatch repair protein MutL, partial [Clostridiales bacterium]|nr:DNA mismatch repair protein MutL [Clostridiales bacterium]